MAVFYSDTGSFLELEVSGSGSGIFTVSGSGGGLLSVSDLTAGANVFQITSASIDLFKIDQSKNIHVSGSLIVTGSISLNGSNIGAGGAGAIQSYFEHIPAIQNSSTSNFGTNANLVQPFVLPYDISIGYVRVPINFSFAQATFATTANTSIAINQSMTYFANIYSAGSGANSKSLQQLAQASVSLLYRASATEGANSAAQTVAHVFSYFTEGITTATAATTITVPATSNFNFTTNVLSVVTGIRMIDIPFATSLAAGEYWIAFQRSSATATSGVNMSAVSLNNQFGFVSQANISGFGFATNNSTGFQMQPGVGTWSATIQGGTTNSIAISNISSNASNPRTPFQFIRFA